MKKFSYTDQDSTMQLIILPLFVFILNWILLNDSYWHNWRVFTFATLVAGTIGYGNWIVNNIVGNYINRRFPYIRQSPQRILWLIACADLLISLAVSIDYGIYVCADSPVLPLHPGQLGWAFAFVLIDTMVVIAIYESILAFNHWQRTLIETEQLRKENLQSQLEGLKSQINPHFLFNSLNSLSSLIEDEPDQAQLFIEEMSSVYRYLLRSNETELATLQQEIQFAQSYFHLLNTRYGDGIRLDLNIDPQLNDRLLPPLTLQILFENVVKHNIILSQQPVTIWVSTTPDSQLQVQNNLQRKSIRVPSNRVGLANILAKYKLLGQETVLIQEEAQTFTVTLPLLVNSG